MFLPALFLLFVGSSLLLSLGVRDISYETAVYILPLAGGYIGVLSALLLTLDIASNRIVFNHLNIKWVGLAIGVLSELTVIHIYPPTLSPFLTFWLPQMIGSFVLFIISYKITVNKCSGN
jgi:hypothetical protein